MWTSTRNMLVQRHCCGAYAESAATSPCTTQHSVARCGACRLVRCKPSMDALVTSTRNMLVQRHCCGAYAESAATSPCTTQHSVARCGACRLVRCKPSVDALVTSKPRAPTRSSPCTGRCPRACARRRRRTLRSHLPGCARISTRHRWHARRTSRPCRRLLQRVPVSIPQLLAAHPSDHDMRSQCTLVWFVSLCPTLLATYGALPLTGPREGPPHRAPWRRC